MRVLKFCAAKVLAICNASILPGIAIVFMVDAGPAQAAAQNLCQWATMADGTKVEYCKDSSGKWKPADSDDGATQSDDTTFPPNTEIHYRGTWSVAVYSRTITRDFNIVATVQGNSISGHVWGRNFIKLPVRGTVRNGTCHLTGKLDTFQGRCDRDGFSGTIDGTTAQGERYRAHFQTSATQLVDLDQQARDRQAAAVAQQQAQAAAEAQIRNAPAAGPALTKKLEGFVRTDSLGWAFNRYDAGSVTNVKIVEGTLKSGNYTLRGEYTYNGGAQGWVLAKMSGPNLDCIQFWDAMIGCRALRTPEQGQAMRDTVIHTFNNPEPGESNNQDPGHEAFMQRKHDEEFQRGMSGN